MTKYIIQTPDGVYFEYTLANLLSRFYAFFIDQLAIILTVVFIESVFRWFVVVSHSLTVLLVIISYFVVTQGYFIFFESRWSGQTPGKRAFHIRVADSNGFQLTFHQILIRNILRMVDGLPNLGLLGGTVAFFSFGHKRLGDMVADTIVIDVSSKKILPIQSLPINKYNSFYKYPHLCARIRKLIKPDEVHLIFEMLFRKQSIESAKIFEIYNEARDCFQKKIQMPQEEINNMNSEQYLINLLNVVVGRKAS